MISKGVAVLGLVALACAGCATGMRSVASEGNGFASPMTSEVQRCEGVHNQAAGMCELMGAGDD